MIAPRIVVMVGAYNEEQYLPETLPAIFAQTVQDFGLLLFDNGSTDRTHEILADVHDGRVVHVRAPRNLMPGEAANLCRQVALGMWNDCPWFLSHGADDLMDPRYLEAILEAGERTGANLVFSPWKYIGDPDRMKAFPRWNRETCHAEHQIPAWHALRRELWEASDPMDETIIAADWDWVVRARHLINPVQLPAPYIALRTRTGERKSLTDEVHWPKLHAHLCKLVGKPAPAWAR